MANNKDGNGADTGRCVCGTTEWTELGDQLEMWDGKGGRV